MTTAIIGVGNIGSLLAQHLVSHGEVVVLAAKNQSRAQALADELGPLARAGSVNDAIAGADPVVFALWVDTIKVAALLPASAHYMKTFGTLGADALAGSANREPRRAVLFYATDDVAATTIERQFGLNGELPDLDQARRRRGRATRMSATPRPPNRTTRQSHGAVGSALNEPTEPRSSQMERESVMSTTTLEIPGYVAGTYTIDPSHSDVAFTVGPTTADSASPLPTGSRTATAGR